MALLLQCSALFGFSIAHEAYLYTFDVSAASAQRSLPTVSSDVGELVVARRSGSSAKTAIGDHGEAILNVVDAFGGYQQPIFNSGTQGPFTKLFLTFEGFDTGKHDDCGVG